MEQLLLTEAEVRATLRMGRSKLWELLMSGAIPSIKVGKCRRIPADALRKWVETQVAEQGAPGEGAA